MQILEQLITAMGQNMEFNVKNICEGEGLTAAVNWHLGTFTCHSFHEYEHLVSRKSEVSGINFCY